MSDEGLNDHHDISIIHISDEDFSQLPLSSANFDDNEDSAMHNYSSMILDIDQEFSDFQLLSPEKTNDWNNMIGKAICSLLMAKLDLTVIFILYFTDL